MIFYMQVDKKTKRVTGYCSNKSERDDVLEIEVDDEDSQFEELLNIPTVFVFDEDKNQFIKDVEFQKKCIEERKSRISTEQKVDHLTKQLAQNKIAIMQKEAIISNLVKQQAKDRIETMKKDSVISNLVKQQAQNKIDIMKLKMEGSK